MFREKGNGIFEVDTEGAFPAEWMVCAKPSQGQSMVERATYLHLNVLGVDHFHNAHHIVKHQAKLCTVI